MTQTEAQASASNVGLDDVMIAMDVVDTLRHDDRIVERELDDADRRRELIERLREIYKGQGIEVPDRILEEGVKALEEDRFTYRPPADSLQTRLAKLYVTRHEWGRLVIGAVGGVAALLLGYYVLVERPRQVAVEAQRVELSETLPSEVNKLRAAVVGEAKDPTASARADGLAKSALNAAALGDRAGARAARDELSSLLADLRAEYTIRIVSRRGELSGLWRIPKANPDAYNYYLVVEAIDSKGDALALAIENEETGKRESVKTWAVRVPRSVLVAVEADKRDDGIIQNAVIGSKSRGELDRRWTVETAGGTITRW